MKTDFSQPQRQSAVGILVMFADTVQNYGRALWPLLVVFIFNLKHISAAMVIGGFAGLIIIVAVIAYLRYLNFTFLLDNQNKEFVVTEGILSKTRTTVSLYKIQQVNIKQSFLQRIVGVYALDVDTAGTNKNEISILAIPHGLALDLKERLLENYKKFPARNSGESTVPDIQENRPFVKISFLSLLKMGITSNYIRSFFLILAFCSSIYENVKRFTGDNAIDEDKIGNFLDSQSAFTAISMLLLFMFIVILATNVIRIVFRYFDYRITRQTGSLLLSFGLLNTKSTIIKPEKVQMTAVVQNFFQKKMNIIHLKIKQATSGGHENKKTAIEIPGCSAFEKDEILTLIFGRKPEKGFMMKPNWRNFGFAAFLTIVLPLLAFWFTSSHMIDYDGRYDFVVVLYVIFMGVVQYFKFKNNRLFINDDFIILQTGAWDISSEIIEPEKIQAITVSQLFWHKSLNIGSLTLHTAGGKLSFHLGNFETVRSYVNLWLYELERNDKNWM